MWDYIRIYGSWLWKILKPVLVYLVVNVQDDVFKIVAKVVEDVSHADMTSEEKREAAFEQAEYFLKNAGKDLGESIIRLLMELAVQKLKQENK